MSEEGKKLSLSQLSPRKGATKSRKRLGRGKGSGFGKTAGRGHKGQNSRSGGGVQPWFEGGAMQLYRRIPKIGFTSRKKTAGSNQFNIVNLATLETIFDSGAEVTSETLKAKGYGTNAANKAGIKVLAYGEISKKLTLKVNAISKSAQQKVEAAGGSVELI